MNGTPPEVPEQTTFRIGTVSKLTGLSTHILRKWESRYDALAPYRGKNGERYYTKADVSRLFLIKRLVDAGSAPRDVACLEASALEKKIDELTSAERAARELTVASYRVAIVGSSVAALFARSTSGNAFDVVACADSEAQLIRALNQGHRSSRDIDVLFYYCPAVEEQTHRTVEAFRAHVRALAAVIVYDFGRDGDLRTLQTPRITTVRAPANMHTLSQAASELLDPAVSGRLQTCGTDPYKTASGVTPGPLLSREAIARIASMSPTIHCECPRHLADIILSLRAFEDYSEACENRNPQDAALHHYLWGTAAEARAMFEQAMIRVAEEEGIPFKN